MTRRCLVYETDEEARRLVTDGEISMADLEQLQRFRVFLKNRANHCPECLEPITDEHGPGSHPEVFAGAKAQWPDLTDDEIRERCVVGWRAYCQGTVSLNAIRGLRR